LEHPCTLYQWATSYLNGVTFMLNNAYQYK
jgi:hypothetical protein